MLLPQIHTLCVISIFIRTKILSRISDSRVIIELEVGIVLIGMFLVHVVFRVAAVVAYA